MKIRINSFAAASAVVLLLGQLTAHASESRTPASDPIARGRYLVEVAGCNDCHTPGYAMKGGKIPESEWLTGDSLGWQGPWGTTYPPNLRLYMKDKSESQWLATAKGFGARPPMPFWSITSMTEADQRALYRYIKSLPVKGVPAPAYLPPGTAPKGPVIIFPSPPPGGTAK